MRERNHFSTKTRLESISHALRGIRTAVSTEHNLWIDLVSAVVAIGLGIWLEISLIEWAILIIIIGLVITAEVFNTAIEHLADAVSTQHNTHLGKAKDVAAGAVLIAAFAAIIVGGIIFVPKIFALL